MPSTTSNVVVTLTYSWRELLRYHFARNRGSLVMPFLATVTTYLLTRDIYAPEHAREFLIGPWLVMIGVFLAIGVGWPFFTLLEMQRDGKIPKSGYRFTFSDSGVSVEAPNDQIVVTWKGISAVTESLTDFYFRRRTQTVFFVPKRAFATESELHEVRELVRSKLGKHASLRTESSKLAEVRGA